MRVAGRDARCTRRYLDRTMVLETTYRTPTGTAVVVDALAMGEGNRGHDLGQGRAASPAAAVRRAPRERSSVDVEYVPRPEYGLVVPLLDAVDGGLAAHGRRRRPGPLVPGAHDRRRRRRPRAGSRSVDGESRRASRCITRKRADDGTARVWSQDEIAARLDDTVAAWQSWSELHQAYVGPWHDLVHHSGRVLQALSFQPTGAICAAATTSLPEVVGGARNWDYRYAWVRDASFTIEALWVAACPDEANEFFDYMTASAAGSLERRRRPADHVRHRRRARPDRARAAAPARAGAARRRCGSATARGTSASSTSTASCSSAVHRLSDQLFDATDGWAEAAPTVGAPPTRADHAAVPRRARRHRRPALAGEGPGDLGGARRAARTSCTRS